MTQNAMRSHLPFMLKEGALYAAAAVVSLQSVDAKALVDVFFANTNGDGVMSIARHALHAAVGLQELCAAWVHVAASAVFGPVRRATRVPGQPRTEGFRPRTR